MIFIQFPHFFFMNIEQRFITFMVTRHIHVYLKGLPEIQMLMLNHFFLISRFEFKSNFVLYFSL